MLIVEIGRHEYHIRDTWADMTLSDAIALHDLFGEMPQSLKDIYLHSIAGDGEQAMAEAGKVTSEDLFTHWPAWQGKVIAAVSDIPVELLEKTNPDQCGSIYSIHIEPLVLGLFGGSPNYDPRGIKFFEHGGARYYLPTDGYKIGGTLRGAHMTAAQFAQANDVVRMATDLSEGKYGMMANFISILCLPKGEVYDEQKSLSRAESFKDLPMTVVWEVYFFIISSLTKQADHILRYLQSAMEAPKGGLRRKRRGWRRGAGTVNYWGHLETIS